MTTVEAFKELMEKYNENRIAWIGKFGSDEGFDAWFTKQVA
jgi:hypothetical protein